jgi:antitoxin VapB
MNAPSKIERNASLFRSNRNQAVRIPKDMEFPEGVKKVTIRKEGDKIILSPAVDFWEAFFAEGPNLDFPERAPQGEYEVRESFDP